MATNKEFKISWKTDTRGLKEANKLLSDMANMGSKVAKSFTGMNLGLSGGAGARGGIAKALLAEKKAFDDLGAAGMKVSRILGETVVQSTQKLRNSITETNTKINDLVVKYEQAQQRLATAPEKWKKGRERAVAGVVGQLQQQMGAKLGLAGQLQELGAEGGGGGFMQQLGGPLMGLISSQGGMLGRLAMAAGPAGLAIAAGLAAAKFVTSGLEATSGSRFEAGGRLGGAERTYRMMQMQGDFSYQIGQARLAGSPEDRERLATAETLARLKSGAWTAVKTGMALPLALFGINASGAIAESGAMEANAAALERRNELIRAMGAEKAELVPQMEAVRAAMPQRMAYLRRYSKESLNNINTLAAEGVDPSMLFGAQDTMAQRLGIFGSGLMLPQVAAAHMAGMDSAIAARSLAASGARGSNLVSQALQGNQDMVARERALQAAAASMENSMAPLTGGGGYYRALMSGVSDNMTGAMQIRTAEQNIKGAEAVGRMGAGFSPYQQTLNLVNAIQNLPGGDIYAQNALSKFGSNPRVLFDVMAGGQVPLGYQGMMPAGVNAGDVLRKQGRDLIGGTLNTYIEQGGSSQAAAIARKAMGHRGGFGGWIKTASDRDIGLLSGVLAEQLPTLFPEGMEEAAAAMRTMRAGAGGKGGDMGGGYFAAGDKAGKVPGAADYRQQMRLLMENFSGIGGAAGRAATELDKLAENTAKTNTELRSLTAGSILLNPTRRPTGPSNAKGGRKK